MARRKQAVNKSQLIREALTENPDKTPSEISAILKGQGLSISPQYVSTIKSTSKAKTGRRGRRGARKLVRAAARTRGDGVGNGNTLGAAVAFVRAAGSITDARAALDFIGEIGQLTR